MIEDAELLRRYAEKKSEAAFAELVRRRIDLIYSVARRQVGGDVQLAEDVTQRVFTDLARKASALAGRAVLSGWLYRSAQFAASDIVRAERRRRVREQEAQLMNNDEGTTRNDAVVDWEKVRPVLDEALTELGDGDRDAVALRFFEERSFAEIGAVLRLTEEAARKRVARALDKLHGLLARRGVTSTTSALGIALANQALVAAPAGLAVSVSGAALAGAAGVGGAGMAATLFTMSKIKIGVIGAVVAAGLATGVVEVNVNRGLRAELRELQGGTGT